MAQQKKRIFWIGFARVCAKSLFCQGFTAKRNDAQKTQSMHYGSCSALLLLQKADRQPPLHEKGAAARISGVVRRLRPFCHRCPGASGRTPQKMHHACKAWCTVSTSGRFAISIYPSLVFRFLNIRNLDIVAQLLKHLDEYLVDDAILLVYEPADVRSGSPYHLGITRLLLLLKLTQKQTSFPRTKNS